MSHVLDNPHRHGVSEYRGERRRERGKQRLDERLRRERRNQLGRGVLSLPDNWSVSSDLRRRMAANEALEASVRRAISAASAHDENLSGCALLETDQLDSVSERVVIEIYGEFDSAESFIETEDELRQVVQQAIPSSPKVYTMLEDA